MIPIDKRIDWNAIRAEYIGGGISQRKLAAKHGVSFNTLKDIANAEKWHDLREQAHNNATISAQQKVVSSAAENAVIAARIQKALLLKIERAVNKMPMDATEVKVVDGQKTVVFRLRDLASSYKDMTENVRQQEDSDILKAAKELLGGIPSAIN